MLQTTPLDAMGPVLAAIASTDRVAVDTEFHAERRYLPRLYLVQLGLPDGTVYLLDPEEDGVLDAVAEPLRSTPWLVHAGRQDLRILDRALGGVPDQVLDTQIAAGLLGPHFPAGYGTLVQRWLGRSLDKASTLSDWSRRPLRSEQLRYAADDARLLPELWKALASDLEQQGRLDLAHEACAEARADALRPVDPDTTWRSIGAAQVVDGPGLAVLQELCGWRERMGQESDSPARSILSDGLVVDLSRRRPSSVNRILSNRRFPRRVVKKFGEELVERIGRASGRPEWGWPTVVRRQSPEERAVAYLELALDTVGAQEGWSRRLVVPRAVLEDIVLHDVGTDADPLERLSAWRRTLAGGALRAALEGSLPLSMDGAAVVAKPR